jgi:general secretion pathway protein B
VAAPAPAPRPAATPAPAPSATAPRLQDLPDHIRSQLPPQSLGGLIYSSTPADRIAIVNGQPYREGDTVARDLVVEEILPRAAVMRWRDQRYQLTY